MIKQNAKKLRKCLFVFGLICIVANSSRANSILDLMNREFVCQSLNVPIWRKAGENTRLVAMLRADRCYLDYDQKAFFKIALLPLARIDGVSIELNQAEMLNIQKLDQWLKPAGASRVELRRVRLSIGTATNLLEVGRMRLGANGEWRLLDGVNYSSQTNRVRAQTGTLWLTGDRAGELTLARAAFSINLCCLTNPPNSTIK